MTKRLLVLWCFFLAVFPVGAQQSLPDPAQWLRSGPMLGYSELTETVIWLQTYHPVRAQIRFWKQGNPASARLSQEMLPSAANDYIARFTLSQLEFGTRYDYEVYLDGLRVERPYPMTFQTQVLWHWRQDPPSFKFAFGSCAYINDPPYDRPGKPYGDVMEIFTAIASQKPDFMVWMGDNLYFREPDWTTESGMRYRYAHSRGLRELQALLASTHHYAIWDDHDFGPNDSDRTFRGKEMSLRIFKDYWMNPTYGMPDTPGVFGRFEWGDTEFFLLDGRYYRSPDDMPESPDKVMFGEPQLRWLMESLRSSTATFKVIVNGSQMMNPFPNPFESFAKFPFEQKKFLSFLRETHIPGVIFLSGDRHHTELIKRIESGMYPLYDFTSSPLTSEGSRLAAEANNPARVPNTWVTATRNFGVIEVTGPKDDRKLILRTFDRENKELWNYEIKASELRFPPVKTQEKKPNDP